MQTLYEKIGIGITTYNSEDYFKDLYDSLPGQSFFDEIVVVNGGEEYKNKYNCDWIQHRSNRYPSVCRNDAVAFLLNKQCEHIFLIEDDMILKNPEVFNKYINTHKKTGVDYFCFASVAENSGAPYKRTPKMVVNYEEGVALALYSNTCNEFTYHHRTCFLKTGLYDYNMRDLFDVDMIYRQTVSNKNVVPFWYFADIIDSDDYVKNNEKATSRLQVARPDGSRADLIKSQLEYFLNKHGMGVPDIPLKSPEEVMNQLQSIKP